MPKLTFANGTTSLIQRVKILDSSSAVGAGLTALTFASTGLIISTIADNEATPTTYTEAGSTIEDITTLGTFAAPTATKCRFKLVDNTNHPGLYEIQIADARWAVTGATSIIITVSGATNAAQVDAEVQLPSVDWETIPTVALIADGVWDELTAGHTISGSFGNAIGLFAGFGSTAVDHDTLDDLGADMTVKASGVAVDNVSIRAYLTSDWTAGNTAYGTYGRGTTLTDVNGEWQSPLYLDTGAYTIVFLRQYDYAESTTTITVT